MFVLILQNGRSLVPFLFEKLESKASVLQPNDIKIWRMYCIKSLSKCIMTEDCTVEVNELCDVLYSQETDNLLVHAKVSFILKIHMQNDEVLSGST